METPDRDDDPVESWAYADRPCHVYAVDGTGGETVWTGYARTKLPGAVDLSDRELQVPGTLEEREDGSWVGFAVSSDDRDAAGTRTDLERLVDQLVELETTLDG